MIKSIEIDQETFKLLQYFGYLDSGGKVCKGMNLSSYICGLVGADLLADMDLGQAKEKWVNKSIAKNKEVVENLKNRVKVLRGRLKKQKF